MQHQFTWRIVQDFLHVKDADSLAYASRLHFFTISKRLYKPNLPAHVVHVAFDGPIANLTSVPNLTVLSISGTPKRIHSLPATLRVLHISRYYWIDFPVDLPLGLDELTLPTYDIKINEIPPRLTRLTCHTIDFVAYYKDLPFLQRVELYEFDSFHKVLSMEESLPDFMRNRGFERISDCNRDVVFEKRLQ